LTYENRANLAPAFLAQIIKKYEGTRLGRQEIEAEVLDDAAHCGRAGCSKKCAGQ
jgi:phage terminase large subunit-like protein